MFRLTTRSTRRTPASRRLLKKRKRLVAGRAGQRFVIQTEQAMDKNRKAPNGEPLLTDPEAASDSPGLPAFLARPEGAPVYHGFPIIEETMTDGWRYGAITSFAKPGGCEAGDGFVIAPDGTRAGLVWSVGVFPTEEVCAPTSDRWGVYSIAFPHTVSDVADLVDCFRAVLSELKALHARIR